jgi:hypothetical protein
MDILNDYLVYPPNPLTNDLSESEISENEEHINTLKNLNNNKKRKKEFTFDDWCMLYSDDLWYIWCIIEQYKRGSNFLDNLEFHSFCSMCYDNSTKV